MGVLTMSKTVVITCVDGCKSEYQDQVYGVGKRLANLCYKTENCRCTVCGKVQPVKPVKK